MNSHYPYIVAVHSHYNGAREIITAIPVSTLNKDEMLLVISTFPDIDKAKMLAHQIVEKQLVACCNIVPGVTSIYRWEGELSEDQECLLIMKTSSSQYQQLEEFIKHHHPYDIPELVAVPVTTGLEEYLSWVIKETS